MRSGINPKKLLLINPAFKIGGEKVPDVGGAIKMEPLGLAYVAALTPPHWEIRLADEMVEEIPWDYDPDLVAITSLTNTAPRAYEIAARFRERDIPVVMGGIHATLLPDEALNYVDVVYRGEAEGCWPQVIRDFETGSLKRLYEGGWPPMEGMPIPRRNIYRRKYLVGLLSASRGCRYRCEFCSIWKFQGGRYRTRPISEVVNELAEHNVGWAILFSDDNVITDRAWAIKLFQSIAERKIKRRLVIQASIQVADDDEFLRWFKRAGGINIVIGFESISEESLKQMRKGINLSTGVAHYREKIARIHDHGLTVSGTFIFGYDGDTPDVFDRTVEFVLESGLDIAHFGVLTPNPGTDLFERLRREGRLLYTNFPADYVRYDLKTAVYKPLRMTPEQLEEGLARAIRAVSAHSVSLKRAWKTMLLTRNPVAAAIAFAWNITGMYGRIG